MRIRPYAFVSAALLAAIGLAGCGSSSSKHDAQDTAAVADSSPRLAVTGKSFSFDPSTVTVAKGEAATVVFKASDISHDFTVKELDIHVHADGGKTASKKVTFDRPGTYTFYCSVAGHRAAGMHGTLTVTP